MRDRSCGLLALWLLACDPSALPAPTASSAPAAAPLPSPPASPAPAAAPAGAPAAPAADQSDPAGPDTWTVTGVHVPREQGGVPAQVAELRVAQQEGFERIVLEFKGNAVPGYRVEYVDRPARSCSSGAPLPLEGDAVLLVQVRPAVAHDERGASTTPQATAPALANVREVQRSCDFEGVVAYVVGVWSPTPFRVFELSAPPRLVIDVAATGSRPSSGGRR